MNNLKAQREERKARINAMHEQSIESIDFNKRMSTFTIVYTGGIEVDVKLNSSYGSTKANIKVDGKGAMSIDARSAKGFHKDLPAQIEKYSEFFKKVYKGKVDAMELMQDEDPILVDYAFKALS